VTLLPAKATGNGEVMRARPAGGLWRHRLGVRLQELTRTDVRMFGPTMLVALGTVALGQSVF
jgi:hypothetical protein